MKKYLFDTNICIYYIRGLFDLKRKFNSIKEEDRYISEITLAELKFGVINNESHFERIQDIQIENWTKTN